MRHELTQAMITFETSDPAEILPECRVTGERKLGRIFLLNLIRLIL